jgi:3D (Asp-Asp-Asp) domain-containing protein
MEKSKRPMITYLLAAAIAASVLNPTTVSMAGQTGATLTQAGPNDQIHLVRQAPTAPVEAKADPQAAYTRKAWITAYSSSPDETDDTPFITAMGTATRDGVVATNFLPFGTKVKIPSLFGDKVFVVEDRMHPRKTNVLDIWMPNKQKALRFGASYTDIVVVNENLSSVALKGNVVENKE